MLPCADPEALCRRLIDRQLDLAAAGSHRLRVPSPRGLLRPGEGRHHHFTPEAFFQISGRADFDLPFERLSLLPDEVLMMPVGMPHWERVSDDRARFRHLVFMFSSDTVAWHLKEFCDRHARPRIIHPTRVIATREAAVAIARLADIAAASHDQRPAAARMVQGAWLMCLALLRRLLAAGGDPAPEESLRISRCRHLIMRGLADPRLGVPALARELGWSPNHLSYRFRQETGTTLVRWIERERIVQAQALLGSTAHSVKEIAAMVGHPDANYFARVFRKLTGLSPSRFRDRAAGRSG